MLHEFVLVQFMKHEWADFFMDPVLETQPFLREGYLAVIAKPMDLVTVNSKLNSGRYHSFVSFGSDMKLIFDNAITFNIDDVPVRA